MKYFLVLLLLFLSVHASAKHKYRGLPRTEVGLMNNVIGCLQYKDTVDYYYLFPPFDTLWQMVMHNPDRSPEAVRALNELKEHPTSILEFDPYYNRSIMDRFFNVLKKGEDSGIHWDQIVLQRYELNREVITQRRLVGYDVICPERFKGYIFVRDLLGRLTFCITITEIQKIQGYFFGGQLVNILEASTIDEYLYKEREEKKYFDWLAKVHVSDSIRDDSLKKGLIDTELVKNDTPVVVKKPNVLAITSSDEDSAKTRKEVVDRKYYEGKFDEEIPVKLFVRYMKDLRTGVVSYYDGLYKFGDQVDYVKLNITRTPDGKWNMEDDPPVGTLELELKDKTYTGSWTNNENQTGYDVVLKQTVIPQKKLELLDKMLETGVVGSADEQAIPEKKPKVSPVQDDEGY
jgi:hypothetical protein